MINWLQPYTTDKNIGREYNRLISLMPDNSWIGITDHDAMFLRADSKAQIETCVRLHSLTYKVFGVMTNRLWGQHQRFKDHIDNDPDINNHVEIARLLSNENYARVKETDIDIAGLCMVFNKNTWEKVGGFKENSICLDREFTDAVKHFGGKLAICTGVYVFHLYRWGQELPGQYNRHLQAMPFDECKKIFRGNT